MDKPLESKELFKFLNNGVKENPVHIFLLKNHICSLTQSVWKCTRQKTRASFWEESLRFQGPTISCDPGILICGGAVMSAEDGAARGKQAREMSTSNWKWQICEGFLEIAERYFVHQLCQPLGDSKLPSVIGLEQIAHPPPQRGGTLSVGSCAWIHRDSQRFWWLFWWAAEGTQAPAGNCKWGTFPLCDNPVYTHLFMNDAMSPAATGSNFYDLSMSVWPKC